jgi:hypothetical protein
MLLTYWIILLALSLVFIFLGNFFKETSISDVLLVVGWGFMFIAGIVMLLGNISHVSGSQDLITYSYDGEGRVNSTTITSVYSYDDLQDETGDVLSKIANRRVLGFFIAILGLLGSIVFWFDARRDPLEEDGFGGSGEGGL